MGSKFKNCKNKINLILVQNLIENSFDALYRGNNCAHSLTLSYFADDISKYKLEKKLNSLPSHEIFCFLVSIGISKDGFDNSFDLLRKYFTKNLIFKSLNFSLENIFD